MRKRLTTIVAVLAAAVVAAGCGGDSGGSATEDALSFVPKDSPLVISIETDPDGEQYKRLNDLIGKFPFAGQVREQFKRGFEQSSGFNFDQDVKPILGNDFVIGVPSAEALRADDSPVVGALKVEDTGKAEELVKKDAQKVGTVEDADIYQSEADTFTAISDDTLVVTSTRADMEAALKRHGSDDGMTEDDFNARLAGLEGDGLLKLGVDLETVIKQDPDSAEALKSKWVAGLRDYGQRVTVEEDGIATDFKLTTEGLSDQDLPFAPGDQAAAVVRRASDVGFGMRDVAQTFRFGEATAKAVDPTKFADYERDKQRLNKALGIDVDRDVVDQLQGEASASVGIDGGFAVRSAVKDPAALQATLRESAPKLKRAFRGESVGVSVPKKPDGFYAIATADGKNYVFGVVDDKFVLATDAERAAQFVAQSAAPVPGTKGSLVMAMDTRSIANQVAKREGQNAAGLFTGALGDFVGSVQTAADEMTGRFKLTIK